MSRDSLWKQLETILKDKITSFDGVAGLALKSLTGEYLISINGDEVFPTASTIKIPVLAKLFSLQEEGEIDLSKRIRFTQDMYGAGSGVIHFLDSGGWNTQRELW